MARGRKVGPRAWTPRDKGDIERCYAAAGDREEFDRRVDAVLRELKRERRRGRNLGRPPNPFFTSFSANRYQGKAGVFVVQFTVNDDKPYREVCIVSRRKRQVDKSGRGKIEIVTPQEASKAIVRPLWKKRENLGLAATLGMTEDAASRRLADSLQEAIRAAVIAEMNWFTALSEPPAYRTKTRAR
jgi:hypothetical protein